MVQSRDDRAFDERLERAPYVRNSVGTPACGLRPSLHLALATLQLLANPDSWVTVKSQDTRNRCFSPLTALTLESGDAITKAEQTRLWGIQSVETGVERLRHSSDV
jgi:hypothetical protein